MLFLHALQSYTPARLKPLHTNLPTLSLVLGSTGIALMLASGLGGCSRTGAPPAPAAAIVNDGGKLHVPEASALRQKLVVQVVESKQAPHTLSAPAVVEADPAHTVAIVPPVGGHVARLDVGLGDRVTQGQALFVIASGDSAQVFTDVDKARDALDLAHKQLDRAHAVRDAGGEATKDVEAAQSAFAQAQAEYDRASARLASFGARKGQARTISVTAPTSGSITTLAVAPGQYLNDTNAVAMTIANLDKVWITANIPEDVLARINKGQAADITLPALPGETLHGTVQFVDDVLAADTRRGKVRITFANGEGKLKPNMYATATFAVPQAAQVIVPQSALLMNNDRTTVFVETAPWTFERRAVVLGADEGDSARVLEGLQAGERIVARGGVLINDQ